MSKPLVLLVDDDQGMIELLTMRIEAMGYSVISAYEGVDALTLLEKQPVDLILTDLRMEPMDGMELFYKVNQRWPTIPVIVLTAHGSIPEAVAATQQGVFSFLTKPVNKEELTTIINQALKHRPQQEQSSSTWDKTIQTRSAKMLRVIDQAKLLAESDVNILITGESGTGKELFAQALHSNSRRGDMPLVALNCSALPGDMLESELFGHVKGAFTGAVRDHPGLVSTANGGTLFLDEIGDMPVALQAKLLRVLQEKRVRRVGDTANAEVDIRVISATHRDLDKAITDGSFREDLYYRLNVVNLHLPNLRERMEDIGYLSSIFLKRIAEREQQTEKKLSPQALERMLEYHWPGNVRQLQNVLENVHALSLSPVIAEQLVEKALPETQRRRVSPLSDAKKEFEREYVIELLRSTEGNVSMAAKLAGRNRSDFYKIVNRHQIEVDGFKINNEHSPA